MKASKNASITFGLVTVPVGVAPAVSSKAEISFRTLHAECKHPVSVRTASNEAKAVVNGAGTNTSLVWCEQCNKEATSTLKGYEFAKNQFVPFTDDEIAEAKGGIDTRIQLSKFIKRESLDPKLVKDQHFLIPNQYGNTYGLLYQSLVETGLVGIGRHSIWGKEYPCAVVADQGYPSGGVMMMLNLNCAEDMVQPDFSAPIPDENEKKMAKQWISGAVGELSDDDLKSEARKRTQDMIAARMSGVELPTRAVEVVHPERDIQDALREMIAGQKKPKKAVRKPAQRRGQTRTAKPRPRRTQ